MCAAVKQFCDVCSNTDKKVKAKTKIKKCAAGEIYVQKRIKRR